MFIWIYHPHTLLHYRSSQQYHLTLRITQGVMKWRFIECAGNLLDIIGQLVHIRSCLEMDLKGRLNPLKNYL